MHKVNRAILVIAAIAISGCGSKWVRLDNSPVVEAEFQQARNACRVDEKLAQLEQIEAQRTESLVRAKTNEAKMLARDDYEIESRAVYAEIDACMEQQGYRKTN